MDRQIKITISGVQAQSARYDGQMTCQNFYIFNDANFDIDSLYNEADVYGDIPYEILSVNPDYKQYFPLMMNFSTNGTFGIDKNYKGLYIGNTEGDTFSFYRREYMNYLKGDESYTFKGEWEPVAVMFDKTVFRDYNIKSGHSYQYIMYPSNIMQGQEFANGEVGSSAEYGDPITVQFDDWSIIELIPEENSVDIPSIKQTYRADINNLWLFKYSLDVGTQKQVLSKNQITTLGQYPKISHGLQNSISGQVSCLLGSEIVPYIKNNYVERMRQSIKNPLSTNEKIYMLNKWREFAYSKNPKLLRDMKGQSWIVTITSNENTPYNSVINQPDKISFAWSEIEDNKNIVIYGSADEIPQAGKSNSIWNPKIILNK